MAPRVDFFSPDAPDDEAELLVFFNLTGALGDAVDLRFTEARVWSRAGSDTERGGAREKGARGERARAKLVKTLSSIRTGLRRARSVDRTGKLGVGRHGLVSLQSRRKTTGRFREEAPGHFVFFLFRPFSLFFFCFFFLFQLLLQIELAMDPENYKFCMVLFLE